MEFNLNKPQMGQHQKLNMTYIMKRSLKIMQMTNLELREFLFTEIEKNPILEIKSNTNNSAAIPNDPFVSIKYKPSLFEHLLKQAKEVFHTKEQLLIAENIIGNLDKKGYFTHDIDLVIKDLNVNLKKVCTILEIIKSFEPKGIAAKNLQERLLIQIENKKSLEYRLLKDHFQDILKNHLNKVAKKLHIEVNDLQKKLGKIIFNANFDPTLEFSNNPPNDITSDITIKKYGKNWIIEIEEDLPFFYINSSYVNILEKEKLSSSKQYVFWAKMLIKNITKRRKTLHNITTFIIKKQRSFLLGKSSIAHMTLQETAKFLKMHPSTISRALMNKYIDTPVGIFPMKSFFSNSFKKERVIKPIELAIKDAIAKEDKNKPLSDILLASELKKYGFNLKRRTVAKYRKKLNIASSHLRKKFY